MKKTAVLTGVVSILLACTALCHAEKWDKNNFEGAGITAGYYGEDSIKTQGSLISWTEKYVFAPDGTKHFTGMLAKIPACKKNIDKRGEVAQFQVDYQIKSGKYRGAAKRYYTKANDLICTDKDLGGEFDLAWHEILRGSPMEEALYDLVSKYKVKVK